MTIGYSLFAFAIIFVIGNFWLDYVKTLREEYNAFKTALERQKRSTVHRISKDEFEQ